MPSPDPSKAKGKQLSVPAAAAAASPVTPPPRSRIRASARGSPLPSRKSHAKQPLHIRMNLTETQMDKITTAFTNKVNESPARRVQVTPTKPQSGPQPGDSGPRRNRLRYSLSSSGDDDDSRKQSAALVDPKIQRQGDLFPASLAERRQQHPTPLNVSRGREPGCTPHHLPMMSVSDAISPLSPVRGGRPERAEEKHCSSAWPSPLTEWRPHASTNSRLVDQAADEAVPDVHKTWVQLENPAGYAESAFRVPSQGQGPRRSKSTFEGLRRADDLPPPPPPPLPLPAHAASPNSETRATESSLFSPLALYFRGKDFPSLRKGGKTLIGQNGWLERTGSNSGPEQKPPQKKAGILESIKKIAKDMTAEFHSSNRRTQVPVKEVSASHVRISLDAREQSLMYCELEFNLTAALNDYIADELDKGHLVPDNLKKVSDWWAAQGRPKVVGFRYDVETQLQLVRLHVNDFNFYGRRQSNPVEIGGLLDAMTTNARQMSVRTFCQPDSVIAKQLVDTQSLFNMISVSDLQQGALAEVAHFFKAIVERERQRDQRERRMRDVRKTHVAQPGEHPIDAEWRRRQGQ